MNRFYTSDDGIRRAFSWQCNLGAGECRRAQVNFVVFGDILFHSVCVVKKIKRTVAYGR